jgi:hypothetical protein
LCVDARAARAAERGAILHKWRRPRARSLSQEIDAGRIWRRPPHHRQRIRRLGGRGACTENAPAVKFKPSHRAARRERGKGNDGWAPYFPALCSAAAAAVQWIFRYLCVRPTFSSIIIHRRRRAAGSFFFFTFPRTRQLHFARAFSTYTEVHDVCEDGKWNQALFCAIINLDHYFKAPPVCGVWILNAHRINAQHFHNT